MTLLGGDVVGPQKGLGLSTTTVEDNTIEEISEL